MRTRLGLLVALALPLTVSLSGVAKAALPECDSANLSQEAKWKTKVEPYFEKGEKRSFLGSSKQVIVTRHFPLEESEKTLVIYPGYAETSQKYKELILDFRCRGYSVHILSLPGMGESGRLKSAASHQVVHVENFSEYVLDAETFSKDVKSKTKNPVYLFTHSTGGLVAAEVMARNPSLFKAAVLSAPLFELNTGSKSKIVVGAVTNNYTFFGYGGSYAMGYSDFDPNKAKFSENIGTQSRYRWERYLEFLKSDPSLWMGGPSNRWIHVILKETKPANLRKLGREVRTPTLVFQAGSDSYVSPGGQKLFCESSANCKLRIFPGSYHEIYRENDVIRTPALNEADAWFSKNR